MPDFEPVVRPWPFPARQPVTEVLEWNTDTLITDAAEQRIALRTVPRSILTYTHLLDGTGLARAAEFARAGALDAWILPLWHLARPTTTPIDAADLTVFADTSEGTFAAPGQAVTATDGGEAVLVEVSVDMRAQKHRSHLPQRATASQRSASRGISAASGSARATTCSFRETPQSEL